MTARASPWEVRLAGLLEQVPWSARVLLALWLAATIVEAAIRMPLGGRGLPLAVQVLAESSPFLLAAALLTGLTHRPGPRVLLAAAAGCFALAGLAEVVVSWRTWGGQPTTIADLNALWFAANAIYLPAVLMLATGLWRAQPAAAESTRAHPALLATIGLVGVLAVVGSALSDARITPPAATVVWIGNGLRGLVMASWAAVAIAVLRRRPAQHRLPGMLIAAGATAVVVAGGLVGWLSFAIASAPPLWALTAVNWTALWLLGLLMVASGLAIGREWSNHGSGSP